MTIQDKTRTTKQGLRDLNFYGSRKKLATEAAAQGAIITADTIAPVITDAEPTTAGGPAGLDSMASGT
jgi:hypothetical protein